ncbi:MAG: hypothetical protein ABIR32_13475 [Ilumatobacteraceae bacterium]
MTTGTVVVEAGIVVGGTVGASSTVVAVGSMTESMEVWSGAVALLVSSPPDTAPAKTTIASTPTAAIAGIHRPAGVEPDFDDLADGCVAGRLAVRVELPVELVRRGDGGAL